MKRKPVVAIIGGSECTPAQAQSARKVGKLLAERDCMLVCGGRTGVMRAVCEGAWSAGGFTIGILRNEDEASQNPFLSLVIPTNMGGARNPLIVQSGQVVIAIGGSYGTLSEIGHAVRMGREVIGLDTWELTPPEGHQDPIHHVETAEDAVEAALSVIRKAEASRSE